MFIADHCSSSQVESSRGRNAGGVIFVVLRYPSVNLFCLHRFVLKKTIRGKNRADNTGFSRGAINTCSVS